MAFKMLATVRAPPIRRSGAGGATFACFSTSWSSSVERGLRDLVQRGDAHQHLGAHLLGEQRQDRRRLLRIQMRQDDRGDLRMLSGDDLRHGLGVHPLQGLDALAGLPGGHAIEQEVRLLLADRLGEHAAHVVLRARRHIGLPIHDADEVVEHGGHLLARHLLELGHRHAELLHFPCVELLQEIGRVLLAQAHEQDRRAFGPSKITRLVSHRRQPNP